MSDEHEVSARIIGGRVAGTEAENAGRGGVPATVSWTVKMLTTGDWSCSCGEEFDTEQGAADHIDEVNR